MIGKLAGARRLHLAEAYQLVAEAMPFVEQPKLFAVQVGGAYYLIIIKSIFACYVCKELFIKQRCLAELFHSRQACHDTCVYLPALQSLLDVLRLHLRYADIQFGIFLHQLRKEARQQIRGDGGKYA